MFGYNPTMQELITWMLTQPYQPKAMKYLMFQLQDITAETITKEMIQQVYPHEP